MAPELDEGFVRNNLGVLHGLQHFYKIRASHEFSRLVGNTGVYFLGII